MRIGIIGGTGLEDRLVDAAGRGKLEAQEFTTPFGPPSAPLLLGAVGGVEVALLARHGAGHALRPSAVPSRANIFALKLAGCTHVVAFGATGSLRATIAPGDLVVCDQLIDRTDGRERSFYEKAAVHVEFADPFCPVMRRWLLQAASTLSGVTVHPEGCYVCIEGPTFSTRAESLLHRQWGADVVGMTALPEARLAREAELAYAMMALPVDYDCWRPRAGDAGDSVLDSVRANLGRATGACISLLAAALRNVEPLAREPSPAHGALDGAIWTERSRIDPEEVERLRPLWGRHLA